MSRGTTEIRPPRTRVQAKKRRHRHRRKRGRRARIVLLLGGTALVVLIVAALSVVLMRRDLMQAADSMLTARGAILRGDAETAERSFAEARSGFIGAQAHLRNPAVIVLGWTPILGRTPDTIAAMTRAGELVAEAGQTATGAVNGLEGGLQAVVPRDGVIPLDTLDRLSAPLDRAHALTEQAVEIMDGTPDSWMLGPVAEARSQFRELLDEGARLTEVGAVLTGDLPAFLGEDGRRRYFFGAQNPAELRGTGGFIGSYTIMTTNGGRIRFGDFTTIGRLPTLDPSEIEPPNPSYGARYDQFGGAGYWRNINMTPDFPSTARAIETLYEETMGVELDGVVVADPFALSALLGVSGPVEILSVDQVVNARNVVPYVTNEAYSEVPGPVRKRLLGDVAKAAFEKFLDGPGSRADHPVVAPVAPDPSQPRRQRPGRGQPDLEQPELEEPELEREREREGGEGRGDREVDALVSYALRSAEAFAAITSGSNLLMHATDDPVQRAFAETGLAGDAFGGSGDYLSVVGNNAGANKVDYYADRSVRYEVRLGAENTGTGRATVTLDNDAPTEGEPRYIIGPHDERFRPGENVTYLSTYCAPSCVLRDFAKEGRVVGPSHEVELGHQVFAVNARVPSGDSGSFTYGWSIDRAWEGNAGSGVYRLTFRNQTTIRPTELVVDVRAPAGMTIRSASPDMEISGDRAVWRGEPSATVTFEVEFGRPLLSRAWHAVLDFLRSPAIRL